MPSIAEHQAEVDSNAVYFRAELPNIPPAANGMWVLLQHRKIIEYFDTPRDTLKYAKLKFGDDEVYSVQQVAEHL